MAKEALEFRNLTGRCLGCGLPMIGYAFLCSYCEEKYPGVIDRAIKDVKREDRVEELERKRQERIRQRRSEFRCI